MTTHSSHDNPFSDAAAVSEGNHDNILESTLPIGANASLTLSADGIIVSDDGFDDAERTLLCGLLQPSERATTISYFHVLDATLNSNTITIKYARPKKPKPNSRLTQRTLIYPVAAPAEATQRWIDRLLDSAYGQAQRQKRIKVLVNPFGGAGKAQTIYSRDISPIFEAAGCSIDIEQTTHRGHAIELARSLDINKYDVLACASGDGLPMECFNGLGQKPNAAEALRKIAVVQLPCGTGNAMSWNLNGSAEPSVAALSIVKGVRTPLDLASITQGDKRTLSFLSQSLGIVAESDLGTENIRWMGDFRFTFGFLVRLLGKTLYPIDYAVKTEIESKEDIMKHYAKEVMKSKHMSSQEAMDTRDKELDAQPGLPPLKHGTINDPLPKDENSGWTQLEAYPNLGNFYCGNMCWMAADAPFFPASLPNDGLLDLVNIDGDISRIAAVKLLLSVGNGTFFGEDIVRVRKVSAIRVYPRFGRAMAEISDTEPTTTGVTQNTSPQSTKGQGALAKLLRKVAGSSGKTGYFAVDGEQLPWEPFQIEIHRGLGTVLSRVPGVYQYEGPKGWQDVNTTSSSRSSTSES